MTLGYGVLFEAKNDLVKFRLVYQFLVDLEQNLDENKSDTLINFGISSVELLTDQQRKDQKLMNYLQGQLTSSEDFSQLNSKYKNLSDKLITRQRNSVFSVYYTIEGNIFIGTILYEHSDEIDSRELNVNTFMNNILLSQFQEKTNLVPRLYAFNVLI